MSNFSISKFESVFYYFLYKNRELDASEFHRKMLYNGMTLRVDMSNSCITSVIDISGGEERILYSVNKGR